MVIFINYILPREYLRITIPMAREKCEVYYSAICISSHQTVSLTFLNRYSSISPPLVFIPPFSSVIDSVLTQSIKEGLKEELTKVLITGGATSLSSPDLMNFTKIKVKFPQ